MLCFLGKNELGQSDKRKTELAGTVGTREISKEELAELLKEELVSVEDCIAGNENIWRQGQTERVGDQDEEAQGATGP